MRFRSLSAVLTVIVLLLTACATPLVRGPVSVGGLVTAITSQARALGALLSGTPAVVSEAAAGTPAAASLSVASTSDCRSGPGSSYATVFAAAPGTKYQILGSDTPDGYWIVTDQAGEICWLPKQGGVVEGSTVGLPEFTVSSAPAMPTPTALPTATPTGPTSTPTPTATVTPTKVARATPTPPAAPRGLNQARSCASSTQSGAAVWIENITLSWFDTQGEMGYTIFQNGSPIANVAQNTTSYQLQLQYSQGSGSPASDTFAVQAYNKGGASPQLTVSVPRCR